MVIAFGVSLCVRGETVDPAAMLASVGDIVVDQAIEVGRAGNVVWFAAARLPSLSRLAPPLTAWWLAEQPSTDGSTSLRFVGPAGVTELTYCQPDRAVESVRHIIETDSGRPYSPGEAPSPMRRLTARLTRVFRPGFTATEIHVTDDGSCLSVVVAGREGDDAPRLIDFQAANPESDDFDPDEPDSGYCIVNEAHIPVHQGLSEIRLAGQTLHLRLTAEAAQSWRLRSTRMKVALRLDPNETEKLREALTKVFAYSAQWPLPQMELGR
jgi:hypothetical protein